MAVLGPPAAIVPSLVSPLPLPFPVCGRLVGGWGDDDVDEFDDSDEEDAMRAELPMHDPEGFGVATRGVRVCKAAVWPDLEGVAMVGRQHVFKEPFVAWGGAESFPANCNGFVPGASSPGSLRITLAVPGRRELAEAD